MGDTPQLFATILLNYDLLNYGLKGRRQGSCRQPSHCQNETPSLLDSSAIQTPRILQRKKEWLAARTSMIQSDSLLPLQPGGVTNMFSGSPLVMLV